MFVMTVIPRLVNAVISVTYVRPHLSPKLIHFDRTIVSTLLSTGVAFSMMSLGHFLRQECGILLVGRMLGPVSVAKYAIVVNITILASGIINMQLRPLLPAVTDAWAKGDYAWIRRTRLRTLSITMGYAIAVALVLAVLGDTIVGLWYGHQLISGSKVPMAVGLSFVLQAWEMNYCLMLFSAGRIWLPVALFTLQSDTSASAVYSDDSSFRQRRRRGCNLRKHTIDKLLDITDAVTRSNSTTSRDCTQSSAQQCLTIIPRTWRCRRQHPSSPLDCCPIRPTGLTYASSVPQLQSYSKCGRS